MDSPASIWRVYQCCNFGRYWKSLRIAILRDLGGSLNHESSLKFFPKLIWEVISIRGCSKGKDTQFNFQFLSILTFNSYIRILMQTNKSWELWASTLYRDTTGMWGLVTPLDFFRVAKQLLPTSSYNLSHVRDSWHHFETFLHAWSSQSEESFHRLRWWNSTSRSIYVEKDIWGRYKKILL